MLGGAEHLKAEIKTRPPVFLAHGTMDQKARWLPRILAADEDDAVWLYTTDYLTPTTLSLLDPVRAYEDYATLDQLAGVPVHECCDRGERPRCCFEIASAGDTAQT